jgi:hypothetical protein
MPQYTIENTDGSRQTISYDSVDDPNWLKKREAFAANLAHGMAPAEAYLAAYHENDTAAIPFKSAVAHARDLLQDTDIALRVYRLKQKVARKVVEKFDFDLTKALEQCRESYNLAYIQGNATAMLKATELMSKLKKILSDTIDVNHRHGLLDDSTTEMLLAMKSELEKKRKRLAHNTVTVVEVIPAKEEAT